MLTQATQSGTTTTFGYNGFGELLGEHTTRAGMTLYRGYDLAGRLTTVTRGGAPLAEYTYDANGNRTSVTTTAGTTTATYDAQDRILAALYES